MTMKARSQRQVRCQIPNVKISTSEDIIVQSKANYEADILDLELTSENKVQELEQTPPQQTFCPPNLKSDLSLGHTDVITPPTPPDDKNDDTEISPDSKRSMRSPLSNVSVEAPEVAFIAQELTEQIKQGMNCEASEGKYESSRRLSNRLLSMSPSLVDDMKTIDNPIVDVVPENIMGDEPGEVIQIPSLTSPLTNQQKDNRRSSSRLQIKEAAILDSTNKPDVSNETNLKTENSSVVEDACLKVKSIEPEKPSKWLVGDLVWCRVPGHPWWPCMVSFDPMTGQYTQSNGTGIKRRCHVQFFGEAPERAWVHEASSVEFKGKEPLLELEKTLAELKKPKFDINPKRRTKWELACSECASALNLDRNERKKDITFQYDPPKSTNKSETPVKREIKKLRRETKKLRKTKSSVSVKKQEIENNDYNSETFDVSNLSVTQLFKKCKSSFDIYCKLNKAKTKAEKPELNDAMLKEHLHHIWISLSEAEKEKYKTPNSPSSKSSTRARKPSKKLVEAVDSLESRRRSSNSFKLLPRNNKKLENKTMENVGTDKNSLDDVINDVINDVLVNSSIYDFTDDEDMKDDEDENSECDEAGAKLRLLKELTPKLSRKRKLTAPQRSMTPPIEKPAKRQKRKASNNSEPVSALEISKAKVKLEIDDDRSSICSDAYSDYDLSDKPVNFVTFRKVENLCHICLCTGKLIQCVGLCLNWFHLNCLGLSIEPATKFYCDECTTGAHTCFICKQVDKDTIKCNVGSCGKFYHKTCLKLYDQTRFSESNGHFSCPLHTCATCAHTSSENSSNNRVKINSRGRLIKCAHCPTAYHTGQFCLAAGVQVLSGVTMICSNHLKNVKGKRHHCHINIGWCFHCNKGGSLICCETCPASYHTDCLEIASPEGNWQCPECESGVHPLFGEIVWVKLGNYRWWPAEIRHPKNVPDNIQHKIHEVGEFPVRFFGSHDYYWTNRGRVFQFHEDDKSSRESTNSKNLAKVFKKAIIEATEAFQKWKKAKLQKEQLDLEKNDKKPPPFKSIRNNIPCAGVQIHRTDLSEMPRCECLPENPCRSRSECLNRMLMYECHPAVCPTGDKCENRRFQLRQYPPIEIYKTINSGWGLRCKSDIQKGSFVIEYVGELIDDEECKRRIKDAHENNILNFYMLTIDKNRIIDAGPKGNVSRFMNHSCHPNCETQKWWVNGDVRVGLFALQAVTAGTELTFNYNLECLGNDKTVCKCGTTNCSGFLGVRPKSAAVLAKERNLIRGKDEKKKKKKKTKSSVFKHDDECFRCGNGGRLLCCDKINCPRAYHLECIDAEKPPYGKWYCPWHLCDVCGKKSTVLCDECPNSFCAKHSADIFTMEDGKTLCEDHDEIIQAYQSSSHEETLENDDSEISTEKSKITLNELDSGAAIVAPETPPNTSDSEDHTLNSGIDLEKLEVTNTKLPVLVATRTSKRRKNLLVQPLKHSAIHNDNNQDDEEQSGGDLVMDVDL